VRAVVDTNIWVSAIISPKGPPARVLQAYRDGRFMLVTSENLLDEVRDVLNRPRIANKYGVQPADVDALIDLMRARAVLVTTTGAVQVCRDPDDDESIEVAIIGQADAVVSRDEDLARAPEVATYLEGKGVRTLTVRRFLEELG
jgi:uncharacterized protein